MNFKEIIGPDELDWKVIPLDWEKIGKDELKLGTPMSKDGVEANDASCYGILMDDVQKDKHFQARVIVSGCVDFAKAEEYSGIKISAEAKKAIGKVWSQGGGVSSWNDLTDKPFYKEQSVVDILPEMTGVPDPEKDNAFFLFDVFDVKVGNTYVVNWNGTEYTCIAAAPPEPETADGAVLGNMSALMGEAPSAEPFILFFFTAETAATIGAGGIVSVLDGSETVTVSVKAKSETIHPIDPEYLPEGYPYKEQSVETLFEGTFDGDGVYFPEPFTLIAGEDYTVVFDEVEYILKTVSDEHGVSVYIGSESLWNGDGNNENEPPFCCDGWAFWTSTNGEHSVIITGPNVTLHTIAPDYLPMYYQDKETLTQVEFEEMLRALWTNTPVYWKGYKIISIGEKSDYTFEVTFENRPYEGWIYNRTDEINIFTPAERAVMTSDFSPDGGGCVPAIGKAEVGQVAVVAAVDANGCPWMWSAVDPNVIASSTPGSTKKFKITVDDNGTLSAVEVK